LTDQSNQSGGWLVLELQIEVIASGLEQRMPRDPALGSEAGWQRRKETVVHQPSNHTWQALALRRMERVNRLRIAEYLLGWLKIALALGRCGDAAQDVHDSAAAAATRHKMCVHGRTYPLLVQAAHVIHPLPNAEMLHKSLTPKGCRYRPEI
jgi:hypothetical protein